MKPRQSGVQSSETKPAGASSKASVGPAEAKGADQPMKQGKAGEGVKSDPPRRIMPLPKSSKSSDPAKQTELPAVAKGMEEKRPKEKKKSAEKRENESLATASVPEKEAVSPIILQEILDELAAMRATQERWLAKEEERRKRKAEKKKKKESKQRKEAEKENEKVREVPEASVAEGSGEGPRASSKASVAEGITEKLDSASVAEVPLEEAN